jgi:membrane associated rhomboid family serine protease
VLILAVIAIIFAAVGLMAMTPEDRANLRDSAREALQPVAAEIARSRVATEPYRTALRARTRWAIAAPAIITVHLLIFARMVFGPLPVAHPEALIAWGANSGPLTTNGDWWRLVSALFVHASIFHLLADLAGLAGIARLIERLAGPLVLVGVYVMAGVIGGLVSLSESPLSVHVGASPAVFGIFGLLLALTAWSHYQRADLRVPLVVFRALAPTVAVFLLYSFAMKGLTAAPNLAGLLVGLGAGAFLGRDIGQGVPAARPAAIALGVVAVAAAGLAFTVRGIVDVRHEVLEVIAIEERTAAPYRAAVRKFTKGEVKAGALAEIITGTIMPELEAGRVKVAALTNVHEQQRPLVNDAQEYLRLRAESWRLRIEALRKSSTQMLRDADSTERASMQALERLRSRPFTLTVRT